MSARNGMVVILILAAAPGRAQNQNAVWLFNNLTGVDFMTSPPTVLQGYSGYGGHVSAMSDENGQLVLFADNAHIWNAQNQVLENGDGLVPTPSSSDHMILPWPGHPGQYYMIQVRAWNPNTEDARSFYHRIDMNGGGGIGEVVEKNILLSDHTAGYLTAVLDSAGTGIWVILHHTSQPLFMAYHLDASGLSTTPVLSEVGPPITGPDQGKGILRPSPDGERLYMSKCYSHCINDTWLHLMDFDRTSGEVSGFITFQQQAGSDGLEVSPSGQFLYNTRYFCEAGIASRLWQYDVSSGDSATIHDSRTLVYEAPISSSCNGRLGRLALAIDGRIHCAVSNGQYLATIGQPDLPAPDCAYVHEGLYLEGDSSWLWLPNQMRAYPIANSTAGIRDGEPGIAQLSVRPVPAGEACWITLPDVGIHSLVLMDNMGRLVREMTRPAGRREVRIDRAGFGSGVYSVVARDRYGRAVATGRVVFE